MRSKQILMLKSRLKYFCMNLLHIYLCDSTKINNEMLMRILNLQIILSQEILL